MKNLLVIVLSFVTMTFAYSQEKTADFGAEATTYQTNRSNGVYIFQLDANSTSLDEVTKAGSYYKDNLLLPLRKKVISLKFRLS